MSLVDRCQKVCASARGPGYLESESLNVYDAATSYFLALMGIYTFRWRLGRLYFGECLTILRTLGLHKPKGQPVTQLGTLPAAMGSHHTGNGDNGLEVDNITLEMGRRIFWTMFVSVRSMEQLGARFGELIIPPPTHPEPYPPLPTEVDDFCIYPTHTEPQPSDMVPMIAGFNANVRIYSAYIPFSTAETAWGIDVVVDWDRQKRVLHESLQRCKTAMTELPEELVVRNTNGFGGPPLTDNNSFYPAFGHPQFNRDPVQSLMSPSSRSSAEQSPAERRRSQYEVQKANIYASSLATRSYLVDKYWNLCDAHDRARKTSQPNSPSRGITAAGIDGMVPQNGTSHYEPIENEMREERESIVRDLLIVLGSIDQVNMEPSANSFVRQDTRKYRCQMANNHQIMKIRSIASTLVHESDQRKGQLAVQAQHYLAEFLKIIMRLERGSPANSNEEQPEDEDAELRVWADLREYQAKFVTNGGVLGLP